MDKIIQLILSLGYNFHVNETRETRIHTYVQNYNGVRHWVKVYKPNAIYSTMHSATSYKNGAIKMYSFREGTGDDDPIITTGVVENPTDSFIREWVINSKEIM